MMHHKYILERASGENDFIEIDQTVAENNERKILFFGQ